MSSWSARFETRQPNPPGSAEDLPFQHYSLQHRVIAWVSRRIFSRFTYTVRHGLIRGMRRKGGLGWLPVWLSRGVETMEQLFWQELPLAGLVIYDIGAFEGILTLFFAARAAQVIAYEPNERNRARLSENVWLNDLGNVEVRKLGVGSQPGTATLRYDPAMAGGGSLHAGWGGPLSQTVEITTLDRAIASAGLPLPDLIKIDVEGWELEALEGARETIARRHPDLFLEMHGETLREKARRATAIVAFLRETGYAKIVHVETNTTIEPGMEALAAEGHLYCRHFNR